MLHIAARLEARKLRMHMLLVKLSIKGGYFPHWEYANELYWIRECN